MENKKFFALNSDCILVKGALRGAIYDLKSGNVFSVNNRSTKILEKLKDGETIGKAASGSLLSENDLIVYLNKLQEVNLGEIVNAFQKREIVVPRLEEIWKPVLHLELTTGCNLRCIHCYNESDITKIVTHSELSFDDWKRVVGEGYEMGCQKVQFIGGEPFLRRILIFDLIYYARDLGYKALEVSSNGMPLTDNDFKMLKENNVELAISFYSFNPQVHDSVTMKAGSWHKTLNSIKKAIKVNLSLRVCVIVMNKNIRDVEKTVNFLKSLGVKNIRSSVIEPAGRGSGDNLISPEIVNRQLTTKPYFPKTDYTVFWRNRFGHNCFLEQICVSVDGEVYPSLLERNISYGNVKQKPLNEIFFSHEALRVRGLNKDRIEACRDCEYRYCCFDCRTRARDFLTSDFHCKPWWCLYDPYSGVWKTS